MKRRISIFIIIIMLFSGFYGGNIMVPVVSHAAEILPVTRSITKSYGVGWYNPVVDATVMPFEDADGFEIIYHESGEKITVYKNIDPYRITWTTKHDIAFEDKYQVLYLYKVSTGKIYSAGYYAPGTMMNMQGYCFVFDTDEFGALFISKTYGCGFYDLYTSISCEPIKGQKQFLVTLEDGTQEIIETPGLDPYTITAWYWNKDVIAYARTDNYDVMGYNIVTKETFVIRSSFPPGTMMNKQNYCTVASASDYPIELRNFISMPNENSDDNADSDNDNKDTSSNNSGSSSEDKDSTDRNSTNSNENNENNGTSGDNSNIDSANNNENKDNSDDNSGNSSENTNTTDNNTSNNSQSTNTTNNNSSSSSQNTSTSNNNSGNISQNTNTSSNNTNTEMNNTVLLTKDNRLIVGSRSFSEVTGYSYKTIQNKQYIVFVQRKNTLLIPSDNWKKLYKLNSSGGIVKSFGLSDSKTEGMYIKNGDIYSNYFKKEDTTYLIFNDKSYNLSDVTKVAYGKNFAIYVKDKKAYKLDFNSLKSNSKSTYSVKSLGSYKSVTYDNNGFVKMVRIKNGKKIRF